MSPSRSPPYAASARASLTPSSPFSYRPIHPSEFDLIAVGTGLPESVVAAAASAIGKTVLHLDPNPFYGYSLSLTELTGCLSSHSLPARAPSSTAAASVDSDHVVVDLEREPRLSDVEFESLGSEEVIWKGPENPSELFKIDLGGPRALFSAGKGIDLLLKSGAAQYLEFKGIDASLVYEPNGGGLVNVPDSRGAIFRDKNLSLKEKNRLMRLLKLVRPGGENENGGEVQKISEEELESPFALFLEKMGLSPKLKSISLFGMAMADYDQGNNEACKDLLKTKDGINRIAQYSASVGRFPNAPGALLYPIHGDGELPQAFYRRAAVKGCIDVLGMSVTSLLMDKDTGCYKGVRLASGQNLYSDQLILDPSLTIPSAISSFPGVFPREKLQMLRQREMKGMVARGICITRSSIKPDVSNCLVVCPPGSLYPEQVTSVRVLQVGSNLAVCPTGTFILYLSTVCNDANEGKRLLKAARTALFTLPVSGNSGSIPIVQSGSEDIEPIVLWGAFFIQKEFKFRGKFGSISFAPTPDGNLNYNDLLDATEKLFGQMYPHEDFFPKTTSPENNRGQTIQLQIPSESGDSESWGKGICHF